MDVIRVINAASVWKMATGALQRSKSANEKLVIKYIHALK